MVKPSSEKRTLRARLTAVVLAGSAAVLGACPATAATRPQFVTLAQDVTLRERPALDAPRTGRLRARTPADAWTVARVVRARTVGDQQWLRVRGGGRRGWVASARTRQAAPPLRLAPGARRRIEEQAARSRASVVFADAETGAPLLARARNRPRTLASVTKLFVTAAALDRLGPSIGTELGLILRPSDNARADRLAGRVGGTAAIRAYARSLGAPVHVRGGSGLDPRSVATAAEVVRFLVAMRRERHQMLWQRGLPVAGRSGTMRDRTRGTAASGRCQAKTGTLIRPLPVSTLAGYCTTSSGRRIAFAILSSRTGASLARSAQDRMLALVMRAR